MQFKFYSTILVFLLLLPGLCAQYENLVFDDHIYVSNIKTPKLHITGIETSTPIIELGTEDGLIFSFDDLDGIPKFYSYTVIHCDRNWGPSNLMFHEYAAGFEDEEIQQFDYSIGTRVPFAHYELMLPNRNCRLLLSGNYLLAVYLNSDRSQPILTRRFMIVEPMVVIDPKKVRPAEVLKVNTHDEIRFSLDTKELNPRLRNPKTDINCVVMQNGRWDNAIWTPESRREMGDILFYDYVNRITFNTGKDFRSMDIRSSQYRSRDIFELERLETHTVAYAQLDQPRANSTFLTTIDANGAFVIRTEDYPGAPQQDLRADYLELVFTLEANRPYDEEVFVFGKFTDWQLRNEFRMEYNEDFRAYNAAVWLKQGFYDYIYVLANADGSADEVTIEGDWYEATNRYQILVYYSPFGARYDRLVGAAGF